VVRHGDFARWNLLQTKDGSIMVLDWEWSTPCGMPGIDLVHLFAQDARLVEKLSANAVIQSTIHALQAQDCQAYLEKTGWGRDYKSAMLASIAFTVGAKQQANEEVLLSLINDW
jgi:aminoglycoside phosphotransferase (APT) family kinase protein